MTRFGARPARPAPHLAAGDSDDRLDEARTAGLLVNEARLHRVRNDLEPPPPRPWAEPINNSLTALWWPAEFFPKLRFSRKTKRRSPAIGAGPAALHPPCSSMHPATLLRIPDPAPTYSPSNLTPAFLENVCARSAVPPQGVQTDGTC
ncbi:MAG TPA: hypothetical protein VFT45_15990 [Longimicrobium sp.]|nr:hypothetical protein [Longimicrobium sp.]